MPAATMDNAHNVIDMSLIQHEIDAEIASHQQDDKQRSYLGKLVDLVWHPEQGTLKNLESLKQTVDQKVATGNVADASLLSARASASIKSDQKTQMLSDEVSGYTTMGLKMVPLFMTGTGAWMGTATMWAADQARPADSFGDQAIDATLGAGKGLAVKGLVSTVMTQPWSLGLKGAVMGAGNRAIDGLLTRQTWEDNNGNLDIAAGGAKVLASATDGKAILSDALVFGAVGGIGAAAGKFVPAIAASPLLATTTTAGLFGFTSGALGEIQKERAGGASIDWSQVALRGGLEGTVYALAAVPGGLQGEMNMRAMQRQMLSQPQTEQMSDPAKPAPIGLKPEDIPISEKLSPEQATQLYSDMSQNGEYNFEKQTYNANVRIAQEGEQITTIKGDTEVAKPNSLLITRNMSDGSVDQYFISPEKLAQRWQPMDGQQSGEAGTYQTRAGAPTKMVELASPVRIGVSWAPDGVTGGAGDFLAQYGPGDYNIVHAPALIETYAGSDPTSAAKLSDVIARLQGKP